MPAPDRKHLQLQPQGLEKPLAPGAVRIRSGSTSASLAAILTVIACAFGTPADAAGLGKLTVTSGLGQPLSAEIDLTSVAKDEAGTITARLAPPEAFSQANLDYSSVLSTLRFSVERRKDGSQYIRVSSTQPVNDPYVDLLLELDWASGRLIREYTFLLDPPEMKSGRANGVSPALAVTPLGPRRGAAMAPPAPVAMPPSAPAPAAEAPAPAAKSPKRGAAPPPAPSASIPPAAPSTSSGSDYQVKQGDTLAKIARENKIDGVTLEQMLIAMYRSSPDAFDGGNINRLRTGATVRVPDSAAAHAVDTSEAHKVVTAQTADFNSYRSRLAGSVATVPTTVEPTQSKQAATGKLTAKVEDRVVKSTDTGDQLKLSKAGATSDKTATGKGSAASGTTSVATAVDKKSGPTAEELAVRDRALKESDTRVKLLQKNVEDLQKLITLKDQNLAELQKQVEARNADVKSANAQAKSAAAAAAAATAAAAAKPAPAPVVVAAPPSPPPPAPVPVTAPVAVPTPPPPAPVAVPQVQATSAVAAPTPTAAPVAPKPVAKAPVTKAPEPSLIDTLLDNSLLLGALALVIIAIIGYGIYTVRRKKRFAKFEDSILAGTSGLHANSVFGTTGGQSVDTSNSSFNSNFVPMAGQVDTNEVDPVAEADVYIAYGRDAQAEEILKEALRAQPDRHAVRLKLLEIYAKRGDKKTFETIASELYATTGGQGEEWKRAAALGATFDAANPLYRDASAAVAAAPIASAASAGSYEKTQTLGAAVMAGAVAASALASAPAMAATTRLTPTAPVAPDPFMSTLPLEPILDLDLTKTEPMPESMTRAIEPAPSGLDLDFDLGFDDAPKVPTASDDPERTVVLEPARTPSPSNLDFDLDLSGPATASPGAPLVPAEPAGHERTIEFNVAKPAPTPDYNATMAMSSPVKPVAPEPPPMADEPMIDFSLDIPSVQDTSEPAPSFEKTQVLDEPFGGITLDLDNGTTSTTGGDEGNKWQEMATKLDLAVAYREIGDRDGARELLEEVVKEGDSAQVEKARELIAALG